RPLGRPPAGRGRLAALQPLLGARGHLADLSDSQVLDLLVLLHLLPVLGVVRPHARRVLIRERPLSPLLVPSLRRRAVLEAPGLAGLGVAVERVRRRRRSGGRRRQDLTAALQVHGGRHGRVWGPVGLRRLRPALRKHVHRRQTSLRILFLFVSIQELLLVLDLGKGLLALVPLGAGHVLQEAQQLVQALAAAIARLARKPVAPCWLEPRQHVLERGGVGERGAVLQLPQHGHQQGGVQTGRRDGRQDVVRVSWRITVL
ncbi:hypothetical protein AALO_G00229130, partial [Alosa alosa]